MLSRVAAANALALSFLTCCLLAADANAPKSSPAASRPAATKPAPSPKPAAAPKASASPKPSAPAAEANKPADTSVLILDERSSWRMHNTFQPPVIQLGSELKQVKAGYYIDHETAPPADGWQKADFDDSSWPREAATRSAKTQTLSRLCLRGRFVVSNPAKVDTLRLRVTYHGGAVVYLNGRELTRANLPKDPATGKSAALADAYPQEAFVAANGKIFPERPGNDAETLRRFALRNRRIEGLAIPKDALAQGVNVLAIEIVRSPYDKVMEEQKAVEGKWARYDLNWYTCELVKIDLRAASDAGLAPNARRPAGLQVWNSNLLNSDFDLSFGDPTEPLRPMEIRGARNGWFSGKVVVGSDKPLRSLKATMSDLKGPQGSIPAAECRVRYGMPWGSELLNLHFITGMNPYPYPRRATLLGAITDKPESNYPLVQPQGKAPTDEMPGVVVPVWVTVHIPAAAAGGEYGGQLKIECEGEKPVVAQVRLKVTDWRLPDPQDYQTWVEMIQAPDTTAVEYNVPLWSERHWQYINQSLSYLKDIGSRVIYVPLIAQNNLGDAESMVRWVPKGGAEGRYDYDFSIMDKYLDAAVERAGKPKLVIFEVWDVYMIRKDKYSDEKLSGQPAATEEYRKARNMMQGTGPLVTVLEDGKTRNVLLPDYSDANSKPLWKPLFEQLRKRMATRGLESAMVLGTVSDFPPAKSEIAFLKDASGDLPWVIHSHHGGSVYGGMAKTAYQTRVWNNDFPTGDPNVRRGHGWRGQSLIANYQREGTVMELSMSAWHNMPEMNIAGEQRGVGRLGLDFWHAVRDKNGERKGSVAARYPQSSRRNLDLYSSMLAPGPDGPVATTRYEAFRQGVEECEARIVIDRALVDPASRAKLGTDLANRSQTLLDDRGWMAIKGMAHLQLCGPGWLYAAWYDMEGPAGQIWFLGSGWEDRAEQTFRLAAVVEKKLKP